MSISDALMILAVLLAPFVAVQVQKWLEFGRERRSRKMDVFRTLMTTRANPVSLPHVQALNMIDIEFSGTGQEAKAVVEAWKLYHDHLNTPDEDTSRWRNRSGELLVDLLYLMSRSLGYEFDKVQLKRGIYSPQAHGDEIMYQQLARRAVLDILRGNRAIPIQDAPHLPPAGQRPSPDDTAVAPAQP